MASGNRRSILQETGVHHNKDTLDPVLHIKDSRDPLSHNRQCFELNGVGAFTYKDEVGGAFLDPTAAAVETILFFEDELKDVDVVVEDAKDGVAAATGNWPEARE